MTKVEIPGVGKGLIKSKQIPSRQLSAAQLAAERHAVAERVRLSRSTLGVSSSVLL